MNSKAAISVSAAIVVAAVAAVCVSVNRLKTAQAHSAAEELAAEKAASAAKEAAKLAEAEALKLKTKEEETRLAGEKAKLAEAEAQAQQLELKTAEERRKTADAEAASAKAASEAAKASKEAEAQKARAARDEKEKAEKLAEAEIAKAKTEADRLAAEKLRSDKVIAEARLMELQQLDLAAMERELIEWKHNLEERERALAPEKTVADLTWAGGTEDSVLDEHGNLQKQVKKPHLVEDDERETAATRKLARTERIVREDMDDCSKLIREDLVSRLEALYVAALREGRKIDAEYYRKNLKSLYPDWTFKGGEVK